MAKTWKERREYKFEKDKEKDENDGVIEVGGAFT